MVAYLGDVDALTEVQCASQLREQSSRPVAYSQTLGGATFAQVGPRTHRTWDIRLPATSTPADLATWHAFVEGEHGIGPWAFFSELAIISNMLTPRASLLASAQYSGGGRMTLTDGSVAGRSMIAPPSTSVWLPSLDGALEHLPVLPGVPATGSAWVSASSVLQLRLDLYDQDMQYVRRVFGDIASTPGVHRLTASVTPQSNERFALLSFGASSQPYRVARPAFSWTTEAPDWSVGKGARKVLITETDTDTTLAIEGRAMAGSSFTITEVG